MPPARQDVPKADAEALKKRKLAAPEAWKTYRLAKGPKFALEKRKPATDLSAEMLQRCGTTAPLQAA